ncbi:hypothetical protein Caci_1045 [Catenulispora acidiphila DSM 44928]|uniref:Uncharacterized protein n=1 Tax=Catenulispora acidiphila (strain DSM 44928 / JCM 14897 / NBRC 102108 / NRRL B-24433 / ID139908) TaxID=479433 RepID=C7Q4B1_CATAD|nr:hypothetical protein [Catenulispora acidiphila]ACU69971.1 hypothetical protein Caci_1045 [Catenulispora acidiphila DSM 44928]
MNFDDSLREAMHGYAFTPSPVSAEQVMAGARRRRARDRARTAVGVVGVAALVSASVFVLLGTSSGSGGAVISPGFSPSASGTTAPDQVPPGQRSPVKQVKVGEAIKVPSDIDGAFYWMTTDSACRYAPHETTTYGKADLATSGFVECDTPAGGKNGRALICRMTVTAPPQTTGDTLPCAGHTPTDKYFSPLFAVQTIGGGNLMVPVAGVMAGPDLPTKVEDRVVDIYVGPDMSAGGHKVVRETRLETLYTVPGMKPGWKFWLPGSPLVYPNPNPPPDAPTYHGAPKQTKPVLTNSYDEIWLYDGANKRMTANPGNRPAPSATGFIPTDAST